MLSFARANSSWHFVEDADKVHFEKIGEDGIFKGGIVFAGFTVADALSGDKDELLDLGYGTGDDGAGKTGIFAFIVKNNARFFGIG